MIGIIGITSSKKLNKQAIITKFLVIGIPIFPTGHYFIDRNNSAKYKAKVCRENIIKGYTLTSLPFIFLILLYLWDSFNVPLMPCFTILTIAILIFNLSYHAEPTFEEKDERLLFQKSITLNAFPEFLILDEQIKIRNSIIDKLKIFLRDYEMDWIENIRTGNYDSFSLPLYFAAMAYEKEINKTDENLELHKILRNKYITELLNKKQPKQKKEF